MALAQRSCPTVGFVLVVVLSGGCGGGSAAARQPTARVERGRIERVVVATGTIEAEDEVEVRSRIPGIVEKIDVKAGDRVQAGQPMIELEKELLLAQLEQARASLRAAQVEEHYSGIALERIERLRNSAVASEESLDAARARTEKATAEHARAEAEVKALEVQLRYATITAPRAGTVLDIDVEVGTAVAPVTSVTGGSLLLTLGNADRVFLKGLVDENDIARLEVGQNARVRTEAFPDRTFEGHLRKITPLGKRVQNVTYFEVEVTVGDDGPQLLRSRMSGDGEIVAEVVDDALVIPETALRYDGDGTHVQRSLASDRNRVEDVRVEVGIVDGARVQVRSGLSEGDLVALQ